MWICPKCNRPFRNENQWHSCVSLDPLVLFKDKPAWMLDAYEKILSKLKKTGEFLISPASSTIYLKHSSTFCAIKPVKESVKIEFYSDKKIISPLIHKSVQISKNRVAHEIIIHGEKEISKQLTDWIFFSYKLTNISK